MTDSGGGSASLRRVVAVGVVALLVGSVAVAGIGTMEVSAAANSADGPNPVKFVYVDADTSSPTFVREDGSTVDTGVTGAEAIGPMADLDSDGLLEAPYVNGAGEVHVVDRNGESQFVAGSARTSATKLGVGDWTDDGTPEVLYATSSSKDIYYANISGSPTKIDDGSASAVLGAVDFDEDGAKDLVYVGTSQTVKYYNSEDETTDSVSGVKKNSGGLGVGAPADFFGNDTYWAPVSDTSGNPSIIHPNQNIQRFNDSSSMSIAPVAGVDWAGDSELEILHLNDDNKVAYTMSNESTGVVAGGALDGAQSAGVAGVASYPASLSVSEFEANATGEQNVTVNVTTNHDLSSLDVGLDGPENTTLALSDFEETSTDPYAYTATYDGSTDGEYTATLESAASAGDSVSPGTEATATVDERVPTVEGANLTDATDGNGTVSPGEDVRVNATVTGDVDTVTADLSDFDADRVELAHESGDEYAANVTVGENVSEGDWNATVTARDGQGNEDATDTNALTVETADLSVSVNDTKTVDERVAATYSPGDVSNADGDVSYVWEFGDGNSTDGKTVNHTFESPGDYTVTLTATDDSDTASDTMNVSVDDVVPSVGSVNLTDATDGDGTVKPSDDVRVNATVTGEVEAVMADLSAFDADTVELTHDSGDTYSTTVEVGESPTDGDQSASVSASDDDGNTDDAETGSLTVNTDSLGVGLNDSRTVTLGEQATYDPEFVSGATGDVTYEWSFGDGTTATGETVEKAYDATGTYTVNLTATDDSETDSDTMTVTVENPPIVESVNLTDATNENGIVVPGDNVTVAATVSGSVDTVEADLAAFDAGTVELAASNGTYTATTTVGENVSDGKQTATVIATGTRGNEDTDGTGALTVDTENLSVTVDDTKTVEENESVELSPASVSDATGDVDYDWTFGDGSSATGKTVTHTYADDGTYEVTLSADDGSGDTDSASMSVTVTDGTTIEGTTTESMTTTSDSTTSDSFDSGGSDGADDPTTAESTTSELTTDSPTDTTTERATATTTEQVTATVTTTETTTATEESTTADPGADIAPPQSPGEAPGFGVLAGLLVLVAAAALALRE